MQRGFDPRSMPSTSTRASGGRPWASVLVVAHEETLRVFAAYAGGLSDEDMIELRFRNCEVIRLDLHCPPGGGARKA